MMIWEIVIHFSFQCQVQFNCCTFSFLFFLDILNCGRRNNPAGCLHFRLADKLKNVEVVSAELWVYHRTDDRINQTFTISEVKQGRSRKVLDTKYTDTNDEWVKFDFSDIIQRWSKRRHSNHVIKVTCKTCRMREIPFESNNELRPFLMIQVGHHISRHRQKRHISCSPRVKDCCKQNFYVTFKELGWDDWIVRPAGYNANYCKGSCEGKQSHENGERLVRWLIRWYCHHITAWNACHIKIWGGLMSISIWYPPNFLYLHMSFDQLWFI